MRRMTGARRAMLEEVQRPDVQLRRRPGGRWLWVYSSHAEAGRATDGAADACIEAGWLQVERAEVDGMAWDVASITDAGLARLARGPRQS